MKHILSKKLMSAAIAVSSALLSGWAAMPSQLEIAATWQYGGVEYVDYMPLAYDPVDDSFHGQVWLQGHQSLVLQSTDAVYKNSQWANAFNGSAYSAQSPLTQEFVQNGWGNFALSPRGEFGYYQGLWYDVTVSAGSDDTRLTVSVYPLDAMPEHPDMANRRVEVVATHADGTQTRTPLRMAGEWRGTFTTADADRIHIERATQSIRGNWSKPQIWAPQTDTPMWHAGANTENHHNQPLAVGTTVNAQAGRFVAGEQHAGVTWDVNFFYHGNTPSGVPVSFTYSHANAPDPRLAVVVRDADGNEEQRIDMFFEKLRNTAQALVTLAPGSTLEIVDLNTGKTLGWDANGSVAAIPAYAETQVPMVQKARIADYYPGIATFAANGEGDGTQRFASAQPDGETVRVIYSYYATNRNPLPQVELLFVQPQMPAAMYLAIGDNDVIMLDATASGQFATLANERPFFGHFDAYPTDADGRQWAHMTLGADGQWSRGQGRLNASGQLRLLNGDQLRFKALDSDLEYLTYYNGMHILHSTFAAGKDVRMYPTTAVRYDEDGVAFEPEGGRTGWTVSGLPTDDEYSTLRVDVSVATDAYFRWGQPNDFVGTQYYLRAFGVDNAPKHYFEFHPQTGLYTVTLDEVCGLYNINADADDSDGYFYGALLGDDMITEIGQPYQLWNHYNTDGVPYAATNDTRGNGFQLGDATGAVASNGSRLVYRNVTFVFDPSSQRLWVYTQPRPDDDGKHDITEPGDSANPLYVVFVSPNEYVEGLLASEGENAGFADAYAGLGDYVSQHPALYPALTVVDGEVTGPEHEVAKAHLAYLDQYFSVVGCQQMYNTVDAEGRVNINEYYSGAWGTTNDYGDTMGDGDGWLDVLRSDIRTPTNHAGDILAARSPGTLAYPANKFDLWVAPTDGNGNMGPYKAERYDMIFYFFSEKPYDGHSSLSQYLSETHSYGARTADNDFSVTRVIDNNAALDGTPGSLKNYVGKRYVHGFNYDNDAVNVEETALLPNRHFAPLGTVRGVDTPQVQQARIGASEAATNFGLFAMKVMNNSKVFFYFNRQEPEAPVSRAYRYDDRMYLVFTDIDQVRDNDYTHPYNQTYPHWIALERAHVDADGNLIEPDLWDTPADPGFIDPYNYVSVPHTRRHNDESDRNDLYRVAQNSEIGNGYYNFRSNRYSDVDLDGHHMEGDNSSYYFLSRKVLNSSAEQLNLREILTKSYNWITAAPSSNDAEAHDALRRHQFEALTADEGQVEFAPQYQMSTVLNTYRTGYMNFFTEDYLNQVWSGTYLDMLYNADNKYDAHKYWPNPEANDARRAAQRRHARAYALSDDDDTVPQETLPEIATTTVTSIVGYSMPDNYVDATTAENPYAYRAYVTLAGGNAPELDPATGRVSYSGSTAPQRTALFSLSTRRTTEVAPNIQTGIEQLVTQPSADGQFSARVTVAPGQIRVAGAQHARIYDVAGRQWAEGLGTLTATVTPGIYVVWADGATRKVRVP